MNIIAYICSGDYDNHINDHDNNDRDNYETDNKNILHIKETTT